MGSPAMRGMSWLGVLAHSMLVFMEDSRMSQQNISAACSTL